MVKGFRFKKNERGFSEKTFLFMRNTIIPTTKLLFKPRITNPQNMPLTGPCFIFGNHSNYFDPFMLNVGLTREPTAGVMTRDQFHKTLPRIFMDSIGIVPTSKYVPEPGIVRSVIKMIDQNRMIVIFPEGGRRWDGKPKPIIETTLKLFWKMKIPIHPVQIHGSHLSWPRWADHYRKSSVEVRFLDPIFASDFKNYEIFSAHCRKLIDFDEYHPPADCMPVSCKKPAAGVQRLLYRCPETGASNAVFSPDGVHIFSRNAGFRYKMNIASRVIDGDGKEHSLIDLYDLINKMPMTWINESEEIVLQHNGSQIYTIDEDHQLVKLNRAIVELTPTGLSIFMGSDQYHLSHEEIRTISVEQNHKLSVTTPNQTLQFTVEGKSALQWKFYMNRLKKGERPVRSI
ncbi:MAG: lysophospholipid acyltransferase family protein [Balneolaceae bacterium]